MSFLEASINQLCGKDIIRLVTTTAAETTRLTTTTTTTTKAKNIEEIKKVGLRGKQLEEEWRHFGTKELKLLPQSVGHFVCVSRHFGKGQVYNGTTDIFINKRHFSRV